MMLGELARLIRSKNAGPFMLTIDIMFDSPDAYHHVVAQGIINTQLVSELYTTRPEDINIYEVSEALAIKVSLPRRVPSGDIGDSDVFGGQQYAPFVDLEVPQWNSQNR